MSSDSHQANAVLSRAVPGRIEKVPLREVWKREANDFTTWLEKNVDVLNDALEISLVSAEREQAAGAFSVELAEDANGHTVVIENQLGRSEVVERRAGFLRQLSDLGVAADVLPRRLSATQEAQAQGASRLRERRAVLGAVSDWRLPGSKKLLGMFFRRQRIEGIFEVARAAHFSGFK